MSAHALLEDHRTTHPSIDPLEQTILGHLDEQTVIGFETLLVLLPDYSWNQVFNAVDRLARGGRLTLRRYRSDYTLFSTHYAA